VHGIKRLPGIELLDGAVDTHVHACPHLNGRTVTVFDAVRQAAAAGMRGLGLMDNFCNSAGYAALAMAELGDLGVEIFGGLIMEPPAGGVTLEAVDAALGYGYGPGTTARFISLPTHHTRHIATLERRSKAYIETCCSIPETGDLPDPLPAILDRTVDADVVLNTGHISGPEAVRLVEVARRRGIKRLLVPASHYTVDEVSELTRLGAFVEFSFFFVSHATQAGLTHVDAETHTVPPVSLPAMVELIRAAAPERTIVNSDAGVFLLPPPVEALREFLLLLQSAGLSETDLRIMSCANPGKLFQLRTNLSIASMRTGSIS
jgi:hypothetical protein